MFLSNLSKTSKLLLILGISSVLVFGFVCVCMVKHASMRTDLNHMQTNLISSQQECCNTGISKHIQSWKDTLLVTPREMHDGLLILILGIITTLAVGLYRSRHYPPDHSLQFYKLYSRDNPDIPLFNHLRFAFSRGILNPKVY